MDRDDFEQWRDNAVTRKVFEKCRTLGIQMEDALKDQLLASLTYSAGDWSDLQGKAAYDRGLIAGMSHVVNITYEEIEDDEPHGDSAD